MESISYYVRIFFKNKVLFIGKYPKIFIYLPIIITVVSVFCALNTKVSKNNSLEIFLPNDLESFKDVKRIQEMFINQEPIRDDYYILDKKIAYFIIEDRTSESNILRNSIIETVATIHNLVMNLKTENGKKFNDLCLKRNHLCQQHPITMLMKKDTALNITKLMARYPYMNFGNLTIDNTHIFGGVMVDEETRDKRGNSKILKAKSIRMSYQLNNEDKDIDEWMTLFNNQMENIKIREGKLYYISSISLPRELAKNGDSLIPYLPWMGIILMISTVGFCISSKSLFSRPFLGICSLINAGMSVLTSISILICIGFPFSEIVYIIPFLMLSIGTDNMFLMLQAWKTKVEVKDLNYLETIKIVSEAIEDVSVPILMTALTDSISYLIGSYSNFFIVKLFCTYSALSIIVMFIYQSTFLTGIMILTCKSEIEGNDINLEVKLKWLSKYSEGYYWLMEKYTNLLERKESSYIVCVLFVIYLSLSGYYISKMDIGINMGNLVSENSYINEEISASERLYENYGLYAYAVIEVSNINLKSYSEREKLIKLYDKFTSTPLLSNDVFFFKIFNKAFPYTFPTEELFKEILLLSLTRPKFSKYKSDFSYNNCSKLNNIKMVFRVRHTIESNTIERVNHLKTVLKESNYNGFVFDNSFIKIDQDSMTVRTSIQNVAIATITIIFVSIILIPKFRTIICVTISVFSMSIGVIGVMSAVGVRLDIISMITMIMSIGYSVDYASHMALHYLDHKKDNLKKSLKFITLPLFQASTTTILGVIILININSYIVKTFTITVFAVVGIGLLHSLIFLPVGLNYLVGEKESLNNNNNFKEINNVKDHNLNSIYTSKDFGIINAYYGGNISE
uniref:SSD domain-containing protein n=1 Tax=Parastrongyloides trichosuri TaxID=131310 RepID=A0A0N4Z1W4_PARTI